MTSHSYFVVMEDFGKRGWEATVSPEITRSAVVQLIKRGNYRNIVFIHHIDGLYVEDVTMELLEEAEALARADHFEAVRIDRQAQAFDRAQDEKKNWEPV